MDNHYRKIIGMFLIQLIMILTLNTPLVFAAINSVEARGQDNVNGYIREQDFITFKAKVSVTGDSTITADQVLLGSNLQFDSCQADIDGFACQLKFPSSGTSIFDPKAIPYTITLKDDAGTIVGTKADNAYVDNLPPLVNSFGIDQSLISSGTVRFTYSIDERACSSSSCSGKCSGISKVEISEPSSTFKETIVLNTGSCSLSDSFEASSALFSDGQHSMLIKAYDKFNQVSSGMSAVFAIDNTAPIIDQSTFRIVDTVDIDTGSFGPSSVSMTARVSIRDIDLDKSNVFADLRQLTGNANTQNVQASCGDTVSGVTQCSWPITLNPGSAGSKDIAITAKDKSGNSANIVISKNLVLDNQGPVILSISSGSAIDGKSFAKVNDNKFTATISDYAGVKPSDIKLHLPNAIRAADSCNKVVDIWECAWNDVDFPSSGKVNVFIDTDSKDRLNNFAQQKFQKEIIVDNLKPKVVDVIIKGIGGSEESLSDFITTGDKLQVQAVVEDDGLSGAVADFSPFVLGLKNMSADSCASTGANKVVCSWTTSAININGFIDSSVSFKFTDIAGNTITHSESLEVLGVISESSDFWKASVKCSPSSLDRSTFSLISQRAFCMLSLEKKSVTGAQDVQVASVSLSDCDGDTSLIESTELMNKDMSQEPVLRLAFKKQDVNFDQIDIACNLNIITRKGNSLVITPEQESVAVSFGLYNQPLGELSASTQKKIDDAVKDADSILSFVTFLDKVVFYSRSICNVGNAIVNVVVLFKVVGKVWSNWDAFTGSVNPPVKGQRMAWDKATEDARQEVLNDYYPGFATKFCGFINCKTVFEDGEVKFSFGGAEAVLAKWQQGGNSIINSIGGDFLKDWTGKEVIIGKEAAGKDVSSYLNPRDSIAVAALTACIPGIIHGMNKYRQIQCMYADCLQTGVGKQGLPVFACEDQKEYATCKYVVGEVFQVVPFTALWNYYLNLIRATLSDPFKIIGAGIAASCIITPEPYSYDLCAGVKIASLLGVTIQEITSIFDADTWKIHDDFCSRLEQSEEPEEKSGGLFG